MSWQAGGRSDRRRSERATAVGMRWLRSVRLLPGRDIALINISSGGALIESETRLVPGAHVNLHLQSTGGRLQLRGRLLRCAVSAVAAERGLRYLGALAFERPFELPREDRSSVGYALPSLLGERRRGHGHQLPERARGHKRLCSLTLLD